MRWSCRQKEARREEGEMAQEQLVAGRAAGSWGRVGGWLYELAKTEPVHLQGFVQTVLALVVAMGFQLTTNQTGAMLAVSASFLSLLTRQQVTPMARPRDRDGNRWPTDTRKEKGDESLR